MRRRWKRNEARLLVVVIYYGVVLAALAIYTGRP